MNIWEIVWKCELTFELLLFSFLMCRNFARKPLFWIRAAAGSGICLFGTLLFVSNTKTMWESIPHRGKRGYRSYHNRSCLHNQSCRNRRWKFN